MKCKRCRKKYSARFLKGKKRKDKLCPDCRDEVSRDIREERGYWENMEGVI